MIDSVIVSHALKDVAAIGQQRLVSYDYQHKQKAPIPDEVRRRIEEIEGRPPELRIATLTSSTSRSFSPAESKP